MHFEKEFLPHKVLPIKPSRRCQIVCPAIPHALCEDGHKSRLLRAVLLIACFR